MQKKQYIVRRKVRNLKPAYSMNLSSLALNGLSDFHALKVTSDKSIILSLFNSRLWQTAALE